MLSFIQNAWLEYLSAFCFTQISSRKRLKQQRQIHWPKGWNREQVAHFNFSLSRLTLTACANLCISFYLWKKICINEVQKAEYDENLNGYGESIRWVTFVFWQRHVLVIPVQRAPADSHGKPCALVSVFGNLCGMHPLSVICLLYSAERDINSHVQAPPPPIFGLLTLAFTFLCITKM